MKKKNLVYENFDLKERVKRMKNDELEKEKMCVVEKYLDMKSKIEEEEEEKERKREEDAKERGLDLNKWNV